MMPTYEYRCNACDHGFELFQSMSDPVKKKCPECGKLALERLIGTGAAVVFKGSGFYQTDYRSESYKKGAEAEKKAGEAPKQDSKPGGTPAKDTAKDTPKKSEPKPKAADPGSGNKG